MEHVSAFTFSAQLLLAIENVTSLYCNDFIHCLKSFDVLALQLLPAFWHLMYKFILMR